MKLKCLAEFRQLPNHSTDRVKMCQWLKKLSELRSKKLSDLMMKHEYLQFLRVTLQGDFQVLTKPFNEPPPA